MFHFLFQPLVPGLSLTLELAQSACLPGKGDFADGIQVGRQVTATVASDSYLFCIKILICIFL